MQLRSTSPHPKTVYFYADGSTHGEGLRVVIQPSRFRNIDALLEFLTEKFPDLPYGVRSIFSPRGRTRIHTIPELNANGHYIVSDKRTCAKGIRLEDRSIQLPGWKTGRVPSGQKLFSYSLKPSEPRANSSDSATKKGSPHGRVIYIHQNGEAFHRQRFLIEGRASNSLADLLRELSFTLGQPVHKLFTLDGKEVQTIEEVLDGPEEYVAVGTEKFRPLAKTQMDLSKKQHRPVDRACVHHGPEFMRHQSATRGPSGSRDPSTKRTNNSTLNSSKDSKRSTLCKNPTSQIRSSRSMSNIPNGRSKHHVPGGNHWLVRLTLGRRDNKTRAEYSKACTSNVFLTVQGTRGCSASLLLSMYQSRNSLTTSSSGTTDSGLQSRKNRPLFSPGQTDEFEVNLGDIGEIVKVRLSHDNTGEYPELLVSHIRMVRMAVNRASAESTGRLRMGLASSASSHSLAESTFPDLTFYFNNWFSRNHGDGQISREVASRASLGLILQEQRRRRAEALRKNQKIPPVIHSEDETNIAEEEMIPLPTVQYCVLVKTSSLWGAGTTALVNILLIGQYGDSGSRTLWNKGSPKHRSFLQGKIDEFKLQCVTLGKLSSLKVWLESPGGKKTSDTWCLDWIQVIEEDETGASNHNMSPRKSAIVRQPPAIFFAGSAWLQTDTVPNDLELIPVTPPSDRIYGLNNESDFAFAEKVTQLWKSMAWAFRNGMEVSFYPLAMEEPLSVMPGGHVVCGTGDSNDSSVGNCFTVHATEYTVTDKPRTSSRLSARQGQHTPLSARDEPKAVFPVFQFTLASKPRLWLKLGSEGSLRVAEPKREFRGTDGFIIRPHLDGFVQLESVYLRGHTERISRLHVDPSDGCVRAGDTTDQQETLFMPHVKGTLRDQGIIMLCTNWSQTLIPQQSEQSSDDLIAVATGSHCQDAHWRVHRVVDQIRTFESVEYCGYYLRVTDRGKVDVMGSGESDCLFRVKRLRAQGHIQLESLKHPGLFLHVNANGSVTTSNEAGHFYPHIVKFGTKRPSRKMITSRSMTLSESSSSQVSNRVSGSISRSSERLNESDVRRNSTVTSRKSSFQRSRTINRKLDKEADWKVQVHTSESAFNSLIVLSVYGNLGSSGPIILGTSDCEKCLFRAGNIDDFKVNLSGIGMMFKIRLEVNPLEENELPYWGLLKVVFENMVTKEQITFDFTNRPFLRMFNHCQLSREQVPSSESLRDFLPQSVLNADGLDPSVGLVLYRLKFYVQVDPDLLDRVHSGPKITIHGRYGDTGRRMIIFTSPDKATHPNEVEMFEGFVEAVYLGPLSDCSIGPVVDSRTDAHLCIGAEIVDPMTGETYRCPVNVWIGSNTEGPGEEVTLKLELDNGTIDEHTNSEYNQLHESVTQMVQQLSDSASENIKKYNSWHSALG